MQAEQTHKQQLFLEAYHACHERFIRYCTALSYGKMDAEDLVQDVLLSAWLHFDTIQKKGELLHYLIRAARNRSVSRWRKRRFHTELLEKHHDQLSAKGASPETLLDIQLLYRMMDQLPDHQRQAVLLFEITGFSIREIAAIQERSEGAVKTNLSRARKKLTALMQEDGSGQGLYSLLHSVKSILL